MSRPGFYDSSVADTHRWWLLTKDEVKWWTNDEDFARMWAAKDGPHSVIDRELHPLPPFEGKRVA